MEIFKLRKPTMTSKIEKALDLIRQDKDIFSYVAQVNKPEYLFWDKAKYKPRPEAITAEDFWALIKFIRKYLANRVDAIIKDEKGHHFSWQPLPGSDYFLHEVDTQLGGILETSIWDTESSRQRFITRGIMEEAIASSQLEGANTTRKVAKRMLLEKRKPSNRSEQMIMNNYEAMQHVEQDMKNSDLDISILINLHTILTRDTIPDADVGRFRKDEDEIVVVDSASNIIYHIPPSEKFLRKEIEKLIRYANDRSSGEYFVHPLIKAILLHFWIGYLHPFTDGNGRMARSIFYWYLLRHKYWAFAYLPISRIIRSSPAQYRDAYIYAEQDDNDLTYFIDYNIRKIKQAKREFENYIRRKEKENREMAIIARAKYGLNDRQIQVLRYLFKNPEATTTINVHARIYNISRMTARKDLEDIEELKFVVSEKVGRERLFKGSSELQKLIQ